MSPYLQFQSLFAHGVGRSTERASYAAFRGFMRSIVGRDVSEHDLDDLAHDALLVGLQRIDTSYGELAVRRYERTTVIRLLVRLRARLRKRRDWVDERDLSDTAVAPEVRIASIEIVEAMHAVLSHDERQLVWRRLAGESYREIARELRLGLATARSAYHRALGKTQRHITRGLVRP
jgi:DNA-directed RNA polymerase specialized sigma24 family protein